jgi:hypothetical protein
VLLSLFFPYQGVSVSCSKLDFKGMILFVLFYFGALDGLHGAFLGSGKGFFLISGLDIG